MSCRRAGLLASIVVALFVSGCGSSVDALRDDGQPGAKPNSAVSAQAAARALLVQLGNGACGCTGAERARARVETGLAKAPSGSVTLPADDR